MQTEKLNLALNAESFQAIASLAYRESGLRLAAEKSSMIQSRLRHRLKVLGVDSFDTYAQLVCSEKGVPERRHMISALTTNVSHFFREQHHFQTLSEKILADGIARLRAGGRMRIWSAGCSNGQEPFSIAITALETCPEIAKLDFKILATDIDPNVIAFGAAGTYPQRLVAGVPDGLLAKYFEQSDGGDEPHFKVKDVLRQMVVFNELNLLAPWPMKKDMDAIFCRNVVIYFDNDTQSALWPRFRSILAPEGYLFLGHSERVPNTTSAGFISDGPTTYRLAATG